MAVFRRTTRLLEGKYTHIGNISFRLPSNDEDGDDLTFDDIENAILHRLMDLRAEWEGMDPNIADEYILNEVIELELDPNTED